MGKEDKDVKVPNHAAAHDQSVIVGMVVDSAVKSTPLGKREADRLIQGQAQLTARAPAVNTTQNNVAAQTFGTGLPANVNR